MWFLVVPYVTWVIFDKAHLRGGRPKQWARRHPIWKYFARKSSVHFVVVDIADSQSIILVVSSRSAKVSTHAT